MLIAFLFLMVIPVGLAGFAIWVLTAQPEAEAGLNEVWKIKI